jgi:hypothetical protein
VFPIWYVEYSSFKGQSHYVMSHLFESMQISNNVGGGHWRNKTKSGSCQEEPAARAFHPQRRVMCLRQSQERIVQDMDWVQDMTLVDEKPAGRSFFSTP